MANEIKGDLKVGRTGDFERRANQGLVEKTITAAEQLLKHCSWWNRIKTDDGGVQDVILPDATLLPKGWQVCVQNYGTIDNIIVKTYDAVTPVLLKSVGLDYAYAFTLMDNSTAAGIWHVNFLEDSTTLASDRYVKAFLVADWGAAGGGYHSFSVLNSKHTRGANPVFQVFEKVATDHFMVFVDQAKVASNGDVTLRVTAADGEGSDVDTRFDGKIVLI